MKSIVASAHIAFCCVLTQIFSELPKVFCSDIAIVQDADKSSVLSQTHVCRLTPARLEWQSPYQLVETFRNKRVAVVLGSFDPWHIAHEAERLLRYVNIILLIPLGNTGGGKCRTNKAYRLAAIENAIGTPGFERYYYTGLSACALQQLFTEDTLSNCVMMKSIFGKLQFFHVIGQDVYEKLNVCMTRLPGTKLRDGDNNNYSCALPSQGFLVLERQPDARLARQPDARLARQPDTRLARQPDTRLARQPDTRLAQLLGVSPIIIPDSLSAISDCCLSPLKDYPCFFVTQNVSFSSTTIRIILPFIALLQRDLFNKAQRAYLSICRYDVSNNNCMATVTGTTINDTITFLKYCTPQKSYIKIGRMNNGYLEGCWNREYDDPAILIGTVILWPFARILGLRFRTLYTLVQLDLYQLYSLMHTSSSSLNPLYESLTSTQKIFKLLLSQATSVGNGCVW
ncbi:MAG: hypothetical protein LBD36_03010 [Holosporales bacterium]|jgi:hypothetical protein|nr:hypothetical protein [Holosporales bacterium]